MSILVTLGRRAGTIAEGFWNGILDALFSDYAWYRRFTGCRWESYDFDGWTEWRRIR